MLHSKGSAGSVSSGLISPNPPLGQGFRVMLSRWGIMASIWALIRHLTRYFHGPKRLTQLLRTSRLPIGWDQNGPVLSKPCSPSCLWY